MKPLIGVMTCPRAGISYLRETVERLMSEGAEDVVPARRFIFSDGPIGWTPRGWTVVVNEFGPSTAKIALWNILRHTTKLSVSLEISNLLLFEDDIVICKNAVRKMLKLKPASHLAAMAYFDLREISTKVENPPGVYCRRASGIDGKGFYGMVAMNYPMETVNFLAGRSYNEVPQSSGGDTFVSLVIERHYPKKDIGVVLPNFFEHRGDISACGNSRGQRAQHFAGVDFDAMTFPAEPEMF